MTFNKYYQDELAFLRELGSEFANTYPHAAGMLSDVSADPDVERLMEGFAFISGKLRQKLDDELPEFTHALIGLMWPHYLRPTPSMSILEFTPKKDVGTIQFIPKDSEVVSRAIEDTSCIFRVCYDTFLLPIYIDDAGYETPMGKAPLLRLKFGCLNNVDLTSIEMHSIRIHLHADSHIAYQLYLRLCTQLDHIRVNVMKNGSPHGGFNLPASAVIPVGFEDNQNLIPYPDHAFMGYRLIQEYFALPEKFLFLDIDQLGQLAHFEDHDNQFEIVFQFKQLGQDGLRVSGGNFRLNCTPIINLFEHDSDPIEIDHTRTEYRVRPQGNKLQHFEIFSIDRVSGLERGSSALQLYHSFYNFRNHQDKETQGRGYYQARTKKSARPRLNDEEIEAYRINQLRESAVDYGTDQFISFVADDGVDARPAVETISIDLTCTNRHLAEKLNVGDICLGNDKTPEFATFKNIIKPTFSVSPPLDAGLHWRLISHLSLNYLSLIDVHAFRGLLELYNFQIFFNQQAARANENRIQGIVSIKSQPQEWIYRGSPIRGRSIHIDMDEDKFAGEGDMYMFACVIQNFFALYSSMNSFTRLTVRGTRRGEAYEWPRRLGHQPIL